MRTFICVFFIALAVFFSRCHSHASKNKTRVEIEQGPACHADTVFITEKGKSQTYLFYADSFAVISGKYNHVYLLNRDSAGRILNYQPKLREGRVSYDYDTLGRLLRINSLVGLPSHSFDYDTLGRLATELVHLGTLSLFRYQFLYDSLGKLILVQFLNQAGVEKYKYRVVFDTNYNPFRLHPSLLSPLVAKYGYGVAWNSHNLVSLIRENNSSADTSSWYYEYNHLKLPVKMQSTTDSLDVLFTYACDSI